MATIKAGFSFNMRNAILVFDMSSDREEIATKNHYHAAGYRDPAELDLWGVGFEYKEGLQGEKKPYEGSIAAYRLIDGSDSFSIKGMHVDLSQWLEVMDNFSKADDIQLFRSIFAGDDTFLGSNTNDVGCGFEGNDRLFGLGGEDFLEGGNGNDVLEGGRRDDHLKGGRGSDVFVFTPVGQLSAYAHDIISDFRHSERDRIDVSAIDANDSVRGNQKFEFIGDTHFSGASGEMRFNVQRRFTLIEADRDGDGDADFSIASRAQRIFEVSDFDL